MKSFLKLNLNVTELIYFDPNLYLSMLLRLGGVYVLISSFNDGYEDGDDDGKKYVYSLEFNNLAK